MGGGGVNKKKTLTNIFLTLNLFLTYSKVNYKQAVPRFHLVIKHFIFPGGGPTFTAGREVSNYFFPLKSIKQEIFFRGGGAVTFVHLTV